ncbi:MAG: efflux RND transporter periplasmic adaptor subunit [Anaerolineales bacterium]|nr:efflux RND transporter periplasmic adaptor subunit [Anaerolineales bacterium]
MKNVYLLITIIIALVLSACGSQATATPIPTLVLDGSNTSPNDNQTSSANSISAAAVIIPVTKANLSFSGTGKVTSVNVQAGDRVEAGQVLVELDTTILEARVKEAEANLAFAEIDLSHLIRMTGCQSKGCAPSYQHIEVKENEVKRAQALVDSAKAVLESQSNLTAPFAGVIVSVDISPAETVTPGQVVILLADLSRYQIETTDLSERDVTKVRDGQSVSIFIEALNEKFSGKVTDIDRIGSTLGGDVVFTVTIDFDKQPQSLLWGMSADVNIEVGE